LADELGGTEHARHIGQRLEARSPGPLALLDALNQQAYHRLGDGEVARAEHRDDPLARNLHHMHLGEGRDMIDTGIGPCIRQEHQAILQIEADAIGHGKRTRSAY